MSTNVAKPNQILVIDDNQAFVTSIIADIPVKWIFEKYDVERLCEKTAREIIGGFADFDNYFVLINLNIKFNDAIRQENIGISFYRLALSKFSSGRDKSILLYSFLNKADLGKENVHIKILPDNQFRRLPTNFNNLLNNK